MIRQLAPTAEIDGLRIRPGLFDQPGANIVEGGVSFTIHSYSASSCTLLLFHCGGEHPFAQLLYPDFCRIGHTYSMIVFDIDPDEIEYAYRFDSDDIILDPYARIVAGQHEWGSRPVYGEHYRGKVVQDTFDWGNTVQPEIPFSDLIIYETHVRGFTMDESSGVEHRGTFSGIIEKIPYLLDLGVNAVELMPIFEFDELCDSRSVDGNLLYNYWGYSTVCFYAPNTGYCADNTGGLELKRLVKTLNDNGIEVILDVVFNHTAEGNEQGRVFSFKGIDNNIYYMLTPDGFYYNFSGCGNTLNCNNPIVRRFILDCLRHWVTEYRVNGFRFDLASILGRQEDGSPAASPPLLESLAFDPILGSVKLIAEAWDAGGLYQVGSFPSWNRWAEWNGRYRDDMRRFLKGDNGVAGAAANRIIGSPDIYSRRNASVNFITCHDGFTLYDLYAYNQKHNESNGWNNMDGENFNNSWNCGAEGESDDPAIQELRDRMRRNAMLSLMCSRGAVMFLAGDEACNTQFGNNNAYCQDNIISWLDWYRMAFNSDMHHFTRRLIEFRKKHPIVRRRNGQASCGLPDVSFHNCLAWNGSFNDDTHTIGIMYAGLDDSGHDDVVFVALNSYWERVGMELPELPGGRWKLELTTGKCFLRRNRLSICPRSSAILVAEF